MAVATSRHDIIITLVLDEAEARLIRDLTFVCIDAESLENQMVRQSIYTALNKQLPSE